jgi:hypothetical protein
MKGGKRAAKIYFNNIGNPFSMISIRDGTSGKGANVNDRTRISRASPPNNFLFIPSGV